MSCPGCLRSLHPTLSPEKRRPYVHKSDLWTRLGDNHKLPAQKGLFRIPGYRRGILPRCHSQFLLAPVHHLVQDCIFDRFLQFAELTGNKILRNKRVCPAVK